MCANLRLVQGRSAAVADELDIIRRLVEVAGMATADLPIGSGATALRTLLEAIEDRLKALSDTVLPRGG